VKDHNIWKEDYIVPIKPSGSPLNLTEVQTEFGGVVPISISEYYSLTSGLPSSGQSFSMSTFYGKTFVVVEQITTNQPSWSPKLSKANFIHIFAVGAGGSGGHGWPARNVGFFRNTDGVAGGSGGGAGGVSYSVIPGTSSGTAAITIGSGGAGVGRTGENGFINGNAGSASSFVGLSLNMTASGGSGGIGSRATSGGGDSTSALGGAGGSAVGGNTLNLTGGSGGGFSVSGSGVVGSAAGGGAPRFLSSHNGTAASSTSAATTNGVRVSLYETYPAILTSYISDRSQSPILGSEVTSFDASNGSIVGGTSTPTHGAGSGGSGAEAAISTGRGGNGIVIIIYEI
jgi:hypothetical protein